MEKLSKSEKILICTGLFMIAMIVGYNAFFVPSINPEMKFLTDVVQNETTTDTQQDESGAESIVNINEANVEELVKINGIGSYLANNIVEYRESNGGFSEISEIKNVKGIGEKLFEKIKNQICV